jgi:hypothetical protein
LAQLIAKEGNVDILLAAGDFVGHKISGDPSDKTKGNKDLLKEVIATTSSIIHKYLPNTLIVPTIGNNDYWYHD